jgi:hypothetical protein
MIILGGTTTLTRDEALQAIGNALESLGGDITTVDEAATPSATVNFRLPAMGVAALATYLGAAGIALDEVAEAVLSGVSAGVHASTLNGTLVVRFDEPDLDEDGDGDGDFRV